MDAIATIKKEEYTFEEPSANCGYAVCRAGSVKVRLKKNFMCPFISE
jgi:hypothetical protein